MGSAVLSIVDLSLLNWSLNEAKTKYENGEISKVKAKLTFIEVVFEDDNPIIYTTENYK